MSEKPTNAQIADVLDRIADALELQDQANPFRVRAYREGAETVRNTDEDIASLAEHNQMDNLRELPSIGEGIAAVIGEYVTTERSELLEGLEGKSSPGAAFAKVPGIGEELAERIANQLHIH